MILRITFSLAHEDLELLGPDMNVPTAEVSIFKRLPHAEQEE